MSERDGRCGYMLPILLVASDPANDERAMPWWIEWENPWVVLDGVGWRVPWPVCLTEIAERAVGNAVGV